MPQEQVILLSDKGRRIGLAPKATVHTDNTPLHRAFSSFIFNSKGELLVQQRAKSKKTWSLVWSNSCCGHPAPGEKTKTAVRRRLKHELGLTVDRLWNILPDYRYRAVFKGVVEHEICPVFVAFTDQEPKLNPSEVENTKWIPWKEFQKKVKTAKPAYSQWCIEETALLAKNKEFQRILKEYTDKK